MIVESHVLWTQPIDESSIVLSCAWNNEGKAIALGPEFGPMVQQPLEMTSLFFEKLPYAVASLIRELHYFFKTGAPMLPFPWALVDESEISSFQKEVYIASMQIPYGETRSYSWIAERIKNPKAVRAVGQALRKNPFPIFIPCHRVVSESGLGGYMGEDDPASEQTRFKEFLLQLEGSYRSPTLGRIFSQWTSMVGSTGANSSPRALSDSVENF